MKKDITKIIAKGIIIGGAVLIVLNIIDKYYAIDEFGFAIGVLACMFIDLMFKIFVEKE